MLFKAKNNFLRLSKDHDRASEIEKTLNNLSFIKKVEPVETNIVIFEIDSIINSDLFINKLNEKGIKIISMGDNKLRIVTHLDYTEEMHQAFLKILNELKF